MLVDFGKANLLDKARQQPDKVRQVLDKVKTDGLVPTLEAVRNKLEQPLPLGYCNVGVVAELGAGVTGFSVGDRVASNGKHAELVSVPVNLCAKIPDGVPDEAAAFTVIGAIALQGIRLVQPTLGEAVVVTGLGLIGLMTVQLLRAHGCRVLGIDLDPRKLELARRFGAEVVDIARGQDPVAAAEAFSRGRGVDAVIITASTKSNEPVHQAALMCRKRGRIVLVGVTGLELSRADFYEKELTFQVSCSYGPGRYDPSYEDKGQDYPVGFVRWTEQRNFEAVLDMLADGRLDVAPLISHRFAIAEAEKAYAVVGGSEPSLGIVLEYPGVAISAASRTVRIGPRGEGEQPSPPAPLHRGERRGRGSQLCWGWQLRDVGADSRVQGSGCAAAQRGIERRGERCARRAEVWVRGDDDGHGSADLRWGDERRRHYHPPRQSRAVRAPGAAGGQACVRREASLSALDELAEIERPPRSAELRTHPAHRPGPSPPRPLAR